MYASLHSSNAYKQAAISVSSLKAVVMLYDGIIRIVSEAKRADAEERFEDRFKLTEKASRILIGLQGQLDFENGGDISPRLSAFYDTLFIRVMQINTKDAQVVADDVLRSLREMRDTWETVRKEIDEENRPNHGQDTSVFGVQL